VRLNFRDSDVSPSLARRATRATIPAPCKPTSAIATFSIPCGTLSYHQRASRVSGAKCLELLVNSHSEQLDYKRRNITSAVISPLSCYVESGIKTLLSKQLDDSPVRCGVNDCSLRERYRHRLPELKLLEDACIGTKPEVVKRRQALDRLRSHPTKQYEEKHCRALGDAVFALDCPAGGEILTTNVVDHKPLADALNITVRRP
jgi:hypothetical protein